VVVAQSERRHPDVVAGLTWRVYLALEPRRFFRIAANPDRPAIAIPSSVIVAGSGIAARPGAVICPLPKIVTGDGPVGGGGLLEAMPVPEPVAPLKIPVPPMIVIVAVLVCTPFLSGGLKGTSSPPKNVSCGMAQLDTSPGHSLRKLVC
jgi:hypothetical protein